MFSVDVHMMRDPSWLKDPHWCAKEHTRSVAHVLRARQLSFIVPLCCVYSFRMTEGGLRLHFKEFEAENLSIS